MENISVGQLVVITHKVDGDTTWNYAVVESVFDNQIHILKKNGGRTIDLRDSTENSTNSKTSEVLYLTSGGELVLSGKNIFGKYNFKPKKA